MNLTEKIELIQSSSSKVILNGGSHQGVPLLKYIYQIHEEVFGMPCKSCSDALSGYIKKIKSINLNDSIMSKQEREYRMKTSSVIRVHGTNKYYSDANITDEVAEKLLKVNPNRASLFAKIPKGALERLAKEKEQEDTEAEAQRVAQEEADAKKAEEVAKLEAEQKAEADANITDETTKSMEVVGDQEVKADEATQADNAPVEKPDAELTLTELREKYPNITARSRAGFLNDLATAKK